MTDKYVAEILIQIFFEITTMSGGTRIFKWHVNVTGKTLNTTNDKIAKLAGTN